jgi:hypothetical protein
MLLLMHATLIKRLALTAVVGALAVGCGDATESGQPGSGSASKRQASAFTVGMNAGPAADWEARVGARLRPSVVRLDFDISTPPSEIAPDVAALAARGTRVQLVASFIGRMPGDADAGRLAVWARTFGPGGTFWRNRSDRRLAMRYIEFGNETNAGYQYDDCGPGCPDYGERARQYALRFKEAQQAIDGRRGNRRVGLLAIAGESGDHEWADAMYAAVPDLSRRAAGWVAHPYGPDYKHKLGNVIAGVSPHGGGRLPIFVTEYGIASDNGRCLSDNYGWPKCLSYKQAADRLSGAIEGMRAAYGKRLAQVLIFAQVDRKPSGATDDREDYFGAVQHDGQAKGPLTAKVQKLLAAHRGR